MNIHSESQHVNGAERQWKTNSREMRARGRGPCFIHITCEYRAQPAHKLDYPFDWIVVPVPFNPSTEKRFAVFVAGQSSENKFAYFFPCEKNNGWNVYGHCLHTGERERELERARKSEMGKVTRLMVIQSSPKRLCFSKGLWSLFAGKFTDICRIQGLFPSWARRACKVLLGDQPFPGVNSIVTGPL